MKPHFECTGFYHKYEKCDGGGGGDSTEENKQDKYISTKYNDPKNRQWNKVHIQNCGNFPLGYIYRMIL